VVDDTVCGYDVVLEISAVIVVMEIIYSCMILGDKKEHE
jgi:hypothetical protein